MVIPLIETVEASASIEAILAVEGLEAIFFGPADLSQSNGHMTVWEGPGIAEDILRMTKLASERGIFPGIIGRGLKEIAQRGEQGFKLVGIGSDVGLFMKQLREYMRTIKNLDLESAWF
jgi:2-keto-3-deoxy-L-rhamnonate aldolase RhmA